MAQLRGQTKHGESPLPSAKSHLEAHCTAFITLISRTGNARPVAIAKAWLVVVLPFPVVPLPVVLPPAPPPPPPPPPPDVLPPPPPDMLLPPPPDMLPPPPTPPPDVLLILPPDTLEPFTNRASRMNSKGIRIELPRAILSADGNGKLRSGLFPRATALRLEPKWLE